MRRCSRGYRSNSKVGTGQATGRSAVHDVRPAHRHRKRLSSELSVRAVGSDINGAAGHGAPRTSGRSEWKLTQLRVASVTRDGAVVIDPAS